MKKFCRPKYMLISFQKYNYISIYSEPETTDIYLDSSLKVVILVVEEAISLSSQYYIAGNPQMIWT